MWPPPLLVLLLGSAAQAQPLIDPLAVEHLSSPGRVERTHVSITLPFQLDTVGHVLVVEPYFLDWWTTTNADHYANASAACTEHMQGWGGIVTFITPLGDARWKLATVGILRRHWLQEPERGMWQPGGALLLSWKRKSTLTWKAGVYLSHEAFGLFVIPLLGLDWRPNEHDRIWGILPGSFNAEHKISARFRAGLTFRAYTNSFGTEDGDFRRMDENPLGLFTDVYFTSHVVLRLEGGYSCLRRVRGGTLDPCYVQPSNVEGSYADHDVGSSPYARVMLAYRLRLD